MREFLRKLLGRTKMDRIEHRTNEVWVTQQVQAAALEQIESQVSEILFRVESVLGEGRAQSRLEDAEAQARALADQVGHLIDELGEARKALKAFQKSAGSDVNSE